MLSTTKLQLKGENTVEYPEPVAEAAEAEPI